ncbi:MAG: helix-turn-helix transcriptional regulator [Sphingomonas sp.]|nr:helix-turn-helix transcriptional regulator [Sphingomonas sp.]
MSLVPAGKSFDWSTKGPIEFAHLYLRPALLDRIVRETFDRDPGGVELIDGIAQRSELIASLIRAIAQEVRSPGASARLLIDSLLHSLAIGLLAERSTLPSVQRARHCISPSQLRRVTDFIDAHYGDDISLDDLARLAGSSRFHFSRGFKAATGLPPYHYLIRRRLDAGKTLLDLRRQSISQIATQCGYGSTRQFSAMFVRIFGVTPRRYRQEH